MARTLRTGLAIGALSLVTGLAVLDRCNRLPPNDHRTISRATIDTGATRLGKAVAPLAAAHPRLSGIHTIRDARDAFAARHVLAYAAERTLDVQYYIWRNDLSGTLLMRALVDAADRGVRVRLLLDDNNTTGLDPLLAALAAHPGIEVRLFNPFAVRAPRAIGYLTDFRRLNRRMHNKSFTVDNQVTIIGGRNVGDEYFGATDGVLFADLDALAIGPVVGEVSADFDRYWASESSYPVERLLGTPGPATLAKFAVEARRATRDAAALAYMDAIRRSSFVQDLAGGTLKFEWATTHLISDPPAKALGRGDRDEMLAQRFRQIFGAPASDVDIVSPYFVPGTSGADLFRGWARRGVRVRILTNSLEATDVALVHAGYAKRRETLLESGVELYELRATSGTTARPAGRLFGSSASSLHAKTFAVDRSRIFIGSFNFDPRSAELNTEMGFVIDSPALAEGIAEVFDHRVPVNAWRVRRSPSGRLEWEERRDSNTVVHHTEPGSRIWKRLLVGGLSRLPIDPLL